jgi:CheY-like chemotaxis protein
MGRGPRYGAITVSAHALEEIRQECFREGFVAYITKPFEAQTLTNAVRHTILEVQQANATL